MVAIARLLLVVVCAGFSSSLVASSSPSLQEMIDAAE
jgi:hypothetical protein